MNIHEEFIEILKWAIARAGSMRKLADATGLDPATFVRWKSKTRVPALDSIQPIFDYLGCSWEEALLKSRGLEPEHRGADSLSEEEIDKIRKALEEVRIEHAKALGQVELLKDLLASAQKVPQMGNVTQTVNGDQNKAVIKADNKGE